MKAKLLVFKNKLGKWLWVIIAVLALIIWRVVAANGKSIKVTSTRVSRGDIVETVSTSGTVKADRFVTLTFPAGGQIVGVGVTAGQKVTKGQFIAQIDTVSLNAAYQNALNTYRSTQAAVDLEHDNDKNYGAAETFSQKSTRTTAEVANDNAYNNVLAARDNLKNAVIYAPFDGVVDTVNPSAPGFMVSAGVANYTVVDPSSVYFDAEVEETDLPNVSVGQKVNIKLDAYSGENFSGIVQTIGAVAFVSSTGGNAYHVRISLPENVNLKFRIGMQGDSGIIYNTISNVLRVSTSALVTENDKSYVFVVKSGVARKVQVEVGGASDTETEIKSGLLDGQEVVDNPPSNLKDATHVSI